MCGIAGFCINPTEIDLPDSAEIAAVMLLAIEHRGTDASGMAWAEPKWSRPRVHKADLSARMYVPLYADKMAPDSQVGIFHTRLATQGRPEVNANNHPIQHGAIVGVHNGHINNDDTLFRELGVGRKAQVDSEAAFALLSHGNAPVTQLLPRLSGRAALAWLDRRDFDNGHNNTLHLARVNGSPLAVCQTIGGSLFFASTMSILRGVMKDLELPIAWEYDLDEGVYLIVKDGAIMEWTTFEVPRSFLSAAIVARTEGTVLGSGKSKGKRKAKPNAFKSAAESAAVFRSGEVLPYDDETYARWAEQDWRWENDDNFVLSDKDLEV